MERENARAGFCALLPVAIKTKRARRDGPAIWAQPAFPLLWDHTCLPCSHGRLVDLQAALVRGGVALHRNAAASLARHSRRVYGVQLTDSLSLPSRECSHCGRAFTLQRVAASKDAFRTSALTDAPSSPRQCQGAHMLVIHPQMKKRSHLCYDSNHDRKTYRL